MLEKFLNPSFITPVAIVFSFWLAGVVIKKFLFNYLVKAVTKINEFWKYVIEPFKSYISFWFFLVGARIAFPFFGVSAKTGGFITNTIVILFITTVTFAVIKVIANLAKYYADRAQSGLQSTTIVVTLIKIAVFVVGLLLVFQSLGIKITPLITALGVGGLAVALALQETLSNLFAGLQIIFAGQVRVGDFVMLESGQQGEVVDITWRNSTIKTREENMIVIPNSTLGNVIVTNYNLSGKNCILRIPVGVSYESDLEKVEKVTIEIAKQVLKDIKGGDGTFEPKVRFTTFNDSSIDLKIILRVKEYFNRFTLQHEFIKRLHKRYNREGIVIPFPIRTIEYATPTDEK
ncbi:MAG: mechanosensitive ion channel family protein [Elusimicrobiota bacterium]